MSTDEIEQKLIEGLNRIYDESGDESEALSALMSHWCRAEVNGKYYTFLDIVNSALGTNVRPETSGDIDDALVGFA